MHLNCYLQFLFHWIFQKQISVFMPIKQFLIDFQNIDKNLVIRTMIFNYHKPDVSFFTKFFGCCLLFFFKSIFLFKQFFKGRKYLDISFVFFSRFKVTVLMWRVDVKFWNRIAASKLHKLFHIIIRNWQGSVVQNNPITGISKTFTKVFELKQAFSFEFFVSF